MMEQWLQIRQRVLREGVSKRQILKETGMHWTTLERILSNPNPPGYCRSKPTYSKIDPYRQRIREILQQDRFVPKKQRHTAHRIWQILQAEGFTGGYTIVKDAVRQIKKIGQDVFMPLVHPPGEAQVDFGQALVKMDGVLRKVHLFVMALPYSDAFFVKAYNRECTETFWDGHVQAFQFLVESLDGSAMTTARLLCRRLLVRVSESLRSASSSWLVITCSDITFAWYDGLTKKVWLRRLSSLPA